MKHGRQIELPFWDSITFRVVSTCLYTAMNCSNFLRTTSIATAALTCLVAVDVRPVFAIQLFRQIDENNALVSFDRVTQIPFTRYLFSGTLEPKVSGTFNLPGIGQVTLPGFQGGNPAVPPEVREAAVQEVIDRYTFTSFIGSYFAASLPGSANPTNSILPMSASFTGAQGNSSSGSFVLSSKLTPTGVVVFNYDYVLTLSNPANPSECSNAISPFCGTATFDFGIAQTLQNVTSYSVSPASAAVPEPSEIAGSGIAISFLGLGWYLKRKSIKTLL